MGKLLSLCRCSSKPVGQREGHVLVYQRRARGRPNCSCHWLGVLPLTALSRSDFTERESLLTERESLLTERLVIVGTPSEL